MVRMTAYMANNRLTRVEGFTVPFLTCLVFLLPLFTVQAQDSTGSEKRIESQSGTESQQLDYAESSFPIEEVTITARRREESIQEVPIAITALGEDFLRNHDIGQFEEVQHHAPSLGVTTTSNSTNVPLISLRGQRPSETVLSVDPAVTLYVADIVMTPSNGSNLSLFDLESAQVLKGPQGTLFGRNITGGAVLFTPIRPSLEKEGYAELTLGDYGLLRAQGAINLPVDHRWQVRLAGKTVRRDGYQSNKANNALRGDDFWDENSTALRLSTLYETDTVETWTIMSWDRNDSKARVPKLVAWNPSAPTGGLLASNFDLDGALMRLRTGEATDVETNVDGFEDAENRFLANHTSWKFHSDITLKNILGYRKTEWLSRFETDGTAEDLIGPPTNGEAGTTEAEQFSEELQFLGKAFEDRLDWIMGAYYYRMQGTQFTRVNIFEPFFVTNPQIAGGDVDNQAYAIFTQGSYQLSDLWSVTVGVRHSWDEREVSVTTLEAGVCVIEDNAGNLLPVNACERTESERYSSPTWLLSASYTPVKDLMIYTSIGSGYRTGGINLRGKNNLELKPYNEETVLNYELGIKADWRLGDWTIRSNFATFWQDYQDVQRTQAVSDGTTFGTTTENAAEATIRGAELELWLIPLEGLELSLNYSYLDAEFDKYIDNSGTDLSDTPFIWVPTHTGAANVRYTLPLERDNGEVSLQLSYYYQGEVETSATQQFSDPQFNAVVHQESYGILSVRLDWQGMMGSSLDLAIFMKNVDDEEYATGGIELLENLGLATRVYGPPRTLGISLRYSF